MDFHTITLLVSIILMLFEYDFTTFWKIGFNELKYFKCNSYVLDRYESNNFHMFIWKKKNEWCRK